MKENLIILVYYFLDFFLFFKAALKLKLCNGSELFFLNCIWPFVKRFKCLRRSFELPLFEFTCRPLSDGGTVMK